MKSNLSHIAIWTSDIQRSRNFYQKYFDGVAGNIYENSIKGFSSYFISFDGGAAIEIMQRKDVSLPNEGIERLGLAHIAFTVNSKHNVDTLVEELRHAGYTIHSEARTTGDGYYEAVVLDPDNNIVEIVA